jgi:site-specific DNA-methyltransferase (adenine-specific)
VNIFITRLLLDPKEKYSLHFYEGNTLEMNLEKTFRLSSFDLVVGNPPYETDPSQPGNKPLYHLFVESFFPLCQYLLFVIPSRWFAGGKGLDKFREQMLQRTDIRIICHQDNSKTWFPSVSIQGGVHYFLRDRTYNGPCVFNDSEYSLSKYDIVVNPNRHRVIDRILGQSQRFLSELYQGRSFGIETNDSRIKTQGNVRCFVSLLQAKKTSTETSEERVRFLKEYSFTKDNMYWKVITARAHGQASDGFGWIGIGGLKDIHTGSYISFQVKNEKEAKSLQSYLQTSFANYMLTIRKVSQDISKSTCKWIPLVPLDREWNDEQVFQYFKINPEELV